MLSGNNQSAMFKIFPEKQPQKQNDSESRFEMNGYDHLFRIWIVGDKNTGKTSLIYQYKDNQLPNYMTLKCHGPLNFKVTHANKTIMLTFPEYNDLSKPPKKILSFPHAALLVCDMTDRKSFENISRWREWCKECGLDDRRKDIHYILVGTKSDSRDQQVQQEELESLAEELGCKGVGVVSANETQGVKELFEQTITGIYNTYYPPTISPDSPLKDGGEVKCQVRCNIM